MNRDKARRQRGSHQDHSSNTTKAPALQSVPVHRSDPLQQRIRNKAEISTPAARRSRSHLNSGRFHNTIQDQIPAAQKQQTISPAEKRRRPERSKTKRDRQDPRKNKSS